MPATPWRKFRRRFARFALLWLALFLLACSAFFWLGVRHQQKAWPFHSELPSLSYSLSQPA